MKVFALSDPHLSFGTPDKLMDRFGPQWVGHAAKIERAWRERVGADDLVIVPGDISWAMNLEGARPDLEFLGRLPGTKLLGKGNHDYWWSTISKVRGSLPPGMHALQGDAIRIGDVVVGGTRLWDIPGASFRDWIDWRVEPADAASHGEGGGHGGAGPTMISPEPGADVAAETERLWLRELGRLERALADIARLAGDDALRIAAVHYPPCDPELHETAATRAFEASAIRHVVFGHLHSVKRDRPRAPFGERGGVRYHFASCDWIDFTPQLVAQT
jgi:predicted phosphohydrolase